MQVRQHSCAGCTQYSYTAESMLAVEGVRLIALASSSADNGSASPPYDIVELLRNGMAPELRLPDLAWPGRKDGDSGTSMDIVSPWWLL